MPIQNRIDTAYTDVEYSENKPTVPEEEIIRRAVVRLNGHILGFVIGLIGALGIFAATNFLVFKGGEVVGPHLGLLDQFLIGYLCGVFIAWVYNSVVSMRSVKSIK